MIRQLQDRIAELETKVATLEAAMTVASKIIEKLVPQPPAPEWKGKSLSKYEDES